MRPYPLTVPAGGQVEFDCFGSRIIQCDAASLPYFEVQVDGGVNIPFKTGRKYTHDAGQTFARVTVQNTDAVNPLAVNLLVGSGNLDDNAVYVDTIQQIVQTVNVADANGLAAINALATLMQNANNKRNALTPLGQYFAVADGLAAAVTTMVAPASNVNGLILRTASMLSTSNRSALYAAPTAPPDANDLTRHAIMFGWSSAYTLDQQLLIPAGNGIYFARGGSSANYAASISYDLL